MSRKKRLMTREERSEYEQKAAERRWQDRKNTLEHFAAVKRGEVDHKILPRAKILIRNEKLKEKLMGK